MKHQLNNLILIENYNLLVKQKINSSQHRYNRPKKGHVAVQLHAHGFELGLRF